MQMLKVKNEKILKALQNHEIGEIVYCEEEDKYFKYGKNGWEETDNKKNMQLNLYQLNKQLISQMPAYNTEDDLEELERKITSNCIHSNIYLLYGKEIGYFTLFERKFYSGDADYTTIGKAVLDCLRNITKKIYFFDFNETANSAEVWIDYQGETTVLYLCDYTNGVVTYE